MTRLSDSGKQILDALRVSADGPLSEARAMPPDMYHSEEILYREQTHVFSRDWVCAGWAAEIPDPGDFLTYSVAEQPVFCIRGNDGTIRTLSNVCRHRMMTLVEGSGRAKKVVCPYHAWTYDLDGSLVVANHMNRTEDFEKTSHCLPEIRTEIWNGWIYLTLNKDAPTLAKALQPLDPLVDRYEMANYVPVVRTDEVWDTNWKFLTENFMEGYHLPVAHKSTVGTWMPMTSVVFPDEQHEHFTYQLFIKDEHAEYGRAHESNLRLEGDWRSTTVMPTIFPSHMYILAPDHIWHLSLRPLGTEQVQVRFGVALAPEVYASLQDRDKWVAELAAFFDRVNQEDKALVERIHAGSRAPDAVGGPLSWLEHELHHFMGYLSRRLR